MSSNKLERMAPEERVAFCREVMERLSELIEGEAPEEFCARVEELMGECQPFHAYLNTLQRTIQMAHELGHQEPAQEMLDEGSFRACVERVRDRIAVTDEERGQGTHGDG